ncbi:hypothetical protein C1X59_04915 [Pseudomonas sp. FW215-R2]|nr:hypothetical protein C1X59_04915 [Pseudomonas sp. FW215-R2]PMX12054.1 hypothetical protein C1X60_05745 [Pseudomonas sp. FW215-L1]PMX25725.1 hypothetical protein C1X57_04485 [Pseudomonas sp. FW215-E1]PNA32726.1 hypothetical protein C1X58_03965 [Pseudomonas sp. FW215-R4]
MAKNPDFDRSHADRVDRSHALRGNTSRDAPRSSSGRDAERPGLHSHAERGNESQGRVRPLR